MQAKFSCNVGVGLFSKKSRDKQYHGRNQKHLVEQQQADIIIYMAGLFHLRVVQHTWFSC